MVTNVPTMRVMAVSMDAHADTDATNMNAHYGSVRRACTQQGQGKNRSDKGFHDNSLSRDASSAWFADIGVDGSRCYEKPQDHRSFQIIQTDTLLDVFFGSER